MLKLTLRQQFSTSPLPTPKLSCYGGHQVHKAILKELQNEYTQTKSERPTRTQPRDFTENVCSWWISNWKVKRRACSATRTDRAVGVFLFGTKQHVGIGIYEKNLRERGIHFVFSRWQQWFLEKIHIANWRVLPFVPNWSGRFIWKAVDLEPRLSTTLSNQVAGMSSHFRKLKWVHAKVKNPAKCLFLFRKHNISKGALRMALGHEAESRLQTRVGS